MAASKQDYEAIAAIINSVGDRRRGNADLLLEVAQHIAAHFEVTNPNFIRSKFISACFKYQQEGCRIA